VAEFSEEALGLFFGYEGEALPGRGDSQGGAGPELVSDSGGDYFFYVINTICGVESSNDGAARSEGGNGGVGLVEGDVRGFVDLGSSSGEVVIQLEESTRVVDGG
jgi:hypothetical protein